MKSIKLNQSIRTSIRNSIILAYKQNNPVPKPVEDNRDALLNKAIVKAYKQKYKDIIKFYNENPSLREFINFRSDILYTNLNGYSSHAPVSSGKEQEFIPHNGKYFINLNAYNNGDKSHGVPNSVVKVIEANKKFYKEKIKPYEKELKDYNQQLTNYIEQVNQVLDNVNTTKQLREAWPEIEEFLPVSAQDPSKISLPSVSVAALNKGVGK